jgi:hypothetical protein
MTPRTRFPPRRSPSGAGDPGPRRWNGPGSGGRNSTVRTGTDSSCAPSVLPSARTSTESQCQTDSPKKSAWRRRKESINMLTSIIGTRLSLHFANGWVFEPAIVGPDKRGRTLDGMQSSTSTTSGWLQELRPRSGTRRAGLSSISPGIWSRRRCTALPRFPPGWRKTSRSIAATIKTPHSLRISGNLVQRSRIGRGTSSTTMATSG